MSQMNQNMSLSLMFQLSQDMSISLWCLKMNHDVPLFVLNKQERVPL